MADFFICLSVGVLLIFCGFLIIGRNQRCLPIGVPTLILGGLTCLGAIYPSYIWASILSGMYRAEAQYLIDSNDPINAQQAVQLAANARKYSFLSKNKAMVKLDNQLIQKGNILSTKSID